MNNRQAGVLLHPTSLPNCNGKLGVLNREAWKFVDWMVESGLTLWQMLPLTEPHQDLSPYQSVSAFALNPALLPDDWPEQFNQTTYALYMANPPFWLRDYALFMAIKETQQGRGWVEWPDELKFREAEALTQFAQDHAEKIERLNKQQFMLSRIWKKLKKYANDKGVGLFGDMPIFVAYDSVDVWANPNQFKLDENLKPTVVTGVPPDYFSETGQRWGNPHYDWKVMQADGFSWWKSRVEETFSQFDLIRIDHFRGLEAVWEIDASEETAINGTWVKTPGEALLDVLQEEFPDLPLVAEDLGVITEEVVELKDKYQLPGMSILQFGFNGLPDNPHSLYEQVENSVTYTGTHDNDTSLGWFESLDQNTQSWVLDQLAANIEKLNIPELLAGNQFADEYAEMPWPLIYAAMNSIADRVIIPMQDLLALGTEHRMNIPGTTEDNWCWQFEWAQLPKDLAKLLKSVVEKTQRMPA